MSTVNQAVLRERLKRHIGDERILVLAPNRWTLRRAVKAVNEALSALGLEKHPDKTFVGRIARGFDFLGYHFSPAGLGLAQRTVEKFQARLSCAL